ncbi:hypothetical protein ACFQHO_53555 [Actinomadura yumaensis]
MVTGETRNEIAQDLYRDMIDEGSLAADQALDYVEFLPCTSLPDDPDKPAPTGRPTPIARVEYLDETDTDRIWRSVAVYTEEAQRRLIEQYSRDYKHVAAKPA